MLYQLKCKDREDFICEIETMEDLDPIIREYRRSYQEVSKSYRNPKGEERDYKLYTWEYGYHVDWIYHKGVYKCALFKAYKDGREISPKKIARADLQYTDYVGDIRRVLADILYVLYILEKDSAKKIERLKWKDTVYTNIGNVREYKDNAGNVRIQFEAENENGEKETILLPVPLNYHKYCLSKFASDLYVLKNNGKERMEHAFSLLLPGDSSFFLEGNNSLGKNGAIIMDFFWKENGEKKGLFYLYGDEKIFIYELTKGDNNIYINSNLRTEKEEYTKVVLSEAEKKYFLDLNLKCKGISEANIFCRKAMNIYEYPMEVKVLIDGAEYVGKRYLNEYQFSGIKEKDSSIDCTVEIQRENGEFKTILGPVKITLKNQVCIDLEKMGMEYRSDTEGLSFPWSVLKNNHVVNKSIYEEIPEKISEEFSEKAVEEIVKEVKKRCGHFVEAFLDYRNEKGEEKLKELSKTKTELEIAEVEKILYPAPLVSDKSVAKIVYEEKKKYEATGKMPNYVLMGGAGCGKSTLVERIAAYMKGAENESGWVLRRVSSDLKGAYVGQTANRVYELLEKADKEGKIIFIDEAYSLQSDQFGKEALEMLLPLISGERKEIECVDLETKETKTLVFKGNVPGIWLAGYEQETREMLVQNPGLYRRMVKLSLTEPTVEGLYMNLLEIADDTQEKAFDLLEKESDVQGKNFNILEKTTKAEVLKKVFKECKQEIKNYFAWATAKEHINYFGNYAGVKDFYTACAVRLEGAWEIDAKRCIKEIIKEKKCEIKKQYKAILTKNERKQNGEAPKFEIQREVDVVLDDVKGNDSAVSGMRQIVKMMVERDVYEREGIHVPKGALLVGPPGTGKTMLARALAGEIQKSYDESEKKEKSVAFISVVSTELNNANKVSALFEEAAEYDNSVIFIDEIDAIGQQRNHSDNARVLFQLMKEMDGFEERKNIFVMAATNAPKSLDPALMRPGRFDRVMEVSYPNEEGRKAILLSYLEKLTEIKYKIEKGGQTKNLEDLAQEIAEKTIGFVPAELKNLINEAAILHKEIEEAGDGNSGSKHRENLVSQSGYECFRADILEVLERIRIGELVEGSKEDVFQDSKNTGSSAVAIHEVGHALVSILLGMEPFEKITIISRGDALGYVAPSRKNTLRTKNDFLKKIKVCLGGRIAEEIFYGDDISMGAVQDIQNATTYAEDMVMLYGMSEEIGPMAIKEYRNNYLGNKNAYRCSEEFVSKAEEEINRILKTQLIETRGILKSQKNIISKLAKYVFEQETLTGAEFKKEYERIKVEV